MPQPENWTPALSQPQPGSDAALALGWAWPAARQACDDHKRGTFEMSWQLWLDMTSLPAIKAAVEQRLASPCGIPWHVDGPTRAPQRFETETARAVEREYLSRLRRSTLSDVIGMGFSVWQHPSAVNPTTLRREILTVERWPISRVRYTATPFPDVWQPGKWIERYYAIQFGIGPSMGSTMYGPQDARIGAWDAHGNEMKIPDGAFLAGASNVWVRFIQLPRPGETDGHWTVIGEGDQPHMNASILALDVSYVGGAILTRSGYNLAKTLGRQSPTMELPPDVMPNSPEGKDAGNLLADIGTRPTAGVMMNGSKIGAFSLTAQNADLFPAFKAGNLEDVELAILGRSGTMAKEDAQYVAAKGPVVRVPEKLIRRDVGVVEKGASLLFTTVARQNVADIDEIRLVGDLPDTEQDERRMAKGERMLKVAAILKAEGEAGCVVDQDRARAVARELGTIAPTVGGTGETFEQWHVQEKVVAPDIVLAALGCDPLPNGAGSPERLAEERLAGKDKAGAKASQGDALIDGKPGTVAPDAEPAPKPTEQIAPGGDVAPTPAAPAPSTANGAAAPPLPPA